jgi:uncharacterized protein (TIGR02217 family)
MAFLETPRFPDCVAVGATGGPGYSTSIIRVYSGFEQRNINHEQALGEWDVGQAARDPANMAILIAFVRVLKARGHGFRFKDHGDYAVTVTEGRLGTTSVGDGTTTAFQLRKLYSQGALSELRDIKKPVSPIKLYINAVLQSSGYTVDYTTGIVTFAAAPSVGAVLSWAGEFDVPARFGDDRMRLTLIDKNNHEWQQIPIMEIRV